MKKTPLAVAFCVLVAVSFLLGCSKANDRNLSPLPVEYGDPILNKLSHLLYIALSEDGSYLFLLQQKQADDSTGYYVYCEKWRYDSENKYIADSLPEWSTLIDTVKTCFSRASHPAENKSKAVDMEAWLFCSAASEENSVSQYVVDADGRFLYKWAGYIWRDVEFLEGNYYALSVSDDGDTTYLFHFKAQELQWIKYLGSHSYHSFSFLYGGTHLFVDDKVLYGTSSKLVHEDIYSGEHLFEVELKGETKPAKEGNSIFFSLTKCEQSGDNVFAYYDEYEKVVYDKIDSLTGTVIGQDYKDEYRNTYCYKLSYPEGEILDWYMVAEQ